MRRFVSGLAAAGVLALAAPAAALDTAGAVPFQPSSQGPTVFQALADEGGSSTTVNLLSAETGEVVEEVAVVPMALNALGYLDSANVLVGLVDTQFVTTFPINNTPDLVTIDAAGTLVNHGDVTPPPGAFGGTVLSYIGEVEGQTFYTLGLSYGLVAGRPTARAVVGAVDISGATPVTTWSAPISFAANAVCQTQFSTMLADIAASRVPKTFVQDIVVEGTTITSVMSGDASGADYLFTMGVDGSSPSCTPLTGDIPGSSGGVARAADGSLVAFSLDDGSVWSVTTSGSTQIEGPIGVSLRGDLASNRSNVTSEQTGGFTVEILVDGAVPSDVASFSVVVTNGAGDESYTLSPNADGTVIVGGLTPGVWHVQVTTTDATILESELVIGGAPDVSATANPADFAVDVADLQAGDNTTVLSFRYVTAPVATTTTTTTTTVAKTSVSTTPAPQVSPDAATNPPSLAYTGTAGTTVTTAGATLVLVGVAILALSRRSRSVA